MDEWMDECLNKCCMLLRERKTKTKSQRQRSFGFQLHNNFQRSNLVTDHRTGPVVLLLSTAVLLLTNIRIKSIYKISFD